MEQDLLRGKEIYSFFAVYGFYGVIGIVVASSLIGYLIYKVLHIIWHNQIEDYDEFLQELTKGHTFLGEIVKNIVKIFLALSFYIMIAAFSAYFSQELGFPNMVGSLLLASVCYFIFMGSIERITKVNVFLIPILMLIIIAMVIFSKDGFLNLASKQVVENFPKSMYTAILYASYNSITLIPIIIPLKKYMKEKKDIARVSKICSAILVILAMCVLLLVLKADVDISKIELPTVYVASQLGKIYRYGYGAVILAAIFTSAISAGYAILENKVQDKRKYKKSAFLLCASSLVVSKIGFSSLVNTLYPVFGILGMIEIVLIVKHH